MLRIGTPRCWSHCITLGPGALSRDCHRVGREDCREPPALAVFALPVRRVHMRRDHKPAKTQPPGPPSRQPTADHNHPITARRRPSQRCDALDSRHNRLRGPTAAAAPGSGTRGAGRARRAWNQPSQPAASLDSCTALPLPTVCLTHLSKSEFVSRMCTAGEGEGHTGHSRRDRTTPAGAGDRSPGVAGPCALV